MLEIDPEAQAPRSFHHPWQRVDIVQIYLIFLWQWSTISEDRIIQTYIYNYTLKSSNIVNA